MGLTVIYSIFIFCLLILVHEFGHFAVAKAVGIKVDEFSLGMGPALLKKKKGDTEYSIRIFPIGGYTKMGEDEESDDPDSFPNRPAWQRALVLAAGSFMNLLTAIFLVFLIILMTGIPTHKIAEINEDSPAFKAGLMPNDEIIMIDGKEVKKWEDIVIGVTTTKNEKIHITVERNGELKEVISEVKKDEAGRQYIGVIAAKEHSVLKSAFLSVGKTFKMAKTMISYLVILLSGKGSIDDLMGPVGIVSIINDQAKLGFIYIANLTAIISLNLAIVNMLPLPALDGGRLFLLVIRRFTGKAISDKMESAIHFAGIIVLLFLTILLVFNDVDRFVL